MNEPDETGSSISSYSLEEYRNSHHNENPYDNLISLSLPHLSALAAPLASPKFARPMGKYSLADPSMPLSV